MLLAAITTFWSAGISALVWGTYRRLDHRIDRLEERVDAGFGRSDKRLDDQIASLRADLTQVALAVGATRHGPRKVE